MTNKNQSIQPPVRPDLHGEDRTRFITLDDVRQKTGQFKIEEPKSNKLAVVGTCAFIIALGITITLFNKRSPSANIVIEESKGKGVKFLTHSIDTTATRDDFRPQQMNNFQPALIGSDKLVPTDTPRPTYEDSTERSPAYSEYETPDEPVLMDENAPIDEF